MRVSVVIPCYNRARFIGDVVESVLGQTSPPDEIIVVDDASTDHSSEIVANLPVRLVRHTHNRGLSASRNSGIKAATGDIVVFIDADAFADQCLLEALLASYGDGVAGTGGRGLEANVHNVYDRWRQLHATQSFGDKPLKHCPYLFGQCCSYRAEVLDLVDGFDEFFSQSAGEDMDIGYRLIDRGYTLHYSPSAIVYHQRSDDLKSLKQSMYRWFYWAFHAKARNKRKPWTLWAGTCRRLLTDTGADLIRRQSVELARVDLIMFRVKLQGLWQAYRDAKYLESRGVHGTV